MIRAERQLIACHDCGHVYQNPECPEGSQIECVHCGHLMRTRHANWEAKVASLTLAGIVLFVLANTFPFLGLEQAGLVQQSNLISGVIALIERQHFLLAALVFITIFLFPLLELLGLAYILLFRMVDIRAPFLGQVLHLLHLSRPWSMLEIFLLGVLVSSIKLAGMAHILPGVGLYAFLTLVVVLIACHLYLDRETIWHWLDHHNYYAMEDCSAEAANPDNRLHTHLYACHCCEALIDAAVLEGNNECPRCDNPVYPRWPRSVQKTTALLIAATVLYIPSNTLPIMQTTNLGSTVSDTIFSGVVHLAEAGDLPIALLVFVASIVIPIAKLLVMAYLLWNVSVRSSADPRQMTRLFKLTEFVGRWSMIDVFVVTILVALVQFGLLANVEPGAALLSFAGVVVLTMLAAETFDSRLIWDAHYSNGNSARYSPPTTVAASV